MTENDLYDARSIKEKYNYRTAVRTTALFLLNQVYHTGPMEVGKVS